MKKNRPSMPLSFSKKSAVAALIALGTIGISACAKAPEETGPVNGAPEETAEAEPPKVEEPAAPAEPDVTDTALEEEPDAAGAAGTAQPFGGACRQEFFSLREISFPASRRFFSALALSKSFLAAQAVYPKNGSCRSEKIRYFQKCSCIPFWCSSQSRYI